MGGGVIRIRYWAAAKAAAGIAEEQVEPAGSLAAVLEVARERHGSRLAAVLERCSFLVDGQQAAPDAPLRDGAVVEVLPPFAGG